MNRRRVLSGLGTALAAGTTGCLSTIRSPFDDADIGGRNAETLYDGDDAWPSQGCDAGNTGFKNVSLVSDPASSSHSVAPKMASVPPSEFAGLALVGPRAYFGNTDELVCYDLANSTTVWTVEIESAGSRSIDSVPIVTTEVVYLSLFTPYRTMAIDRDDGEVLWEQQAGIWRGAAGVTDHLYALGENRAVAALDLDTGDVQWESEKTGYRSLAIDEGDVVYATKPGDPEGGSSRVTSGTVSAFEAGRSRWDRDDFPLLATAPVVSDGTVFVRDGDGTVYALDTATGATRWTVEAGGSVVSSPAVSPERIYVSGEGGRMLCLDRETGELLWEVETGTTAVQPVAVADGVYVPTANDGVFALEDDGAVAWQSPHRTFHTAAATDGAFALLSNAGLVSIE